MNDSTSMGMIGRSSDTRLAVENHRLRAVVAGHEKAIESLAAHAKQHCRGCNGKGTITKTYDEYSMADPKDVPCPFCADVDAIVAATRMVSSHFNSLF